MVIINLMPKKLLWTTSLDKFRPGHKGISPPHKISRTHFRPGGNYQSYFRPSEIPPGPISAPAKSHQSPFSPQRIYSSLFSPRRKSIRTNIRPGEIDLRPGENRRNQFLKFRISLVLWHNSSSPSQTLHLLT